MGVDFSPRSLEVARQRAAACGREDVMFHELAVEDIGSLGQTWDYINCQDVMYMVPDTVKALAALKAVLTDDGIIRFDFHAKYVRQNMLRAQEACRMLGLYQQNPEEREVALVKELFGAMNHNTNLKQRCWGPSYENGEPSLILMNQLIQGDRAWTINEVFAALEAAGLEFVQMVNWLGWSVQNLFQNGAIPPEIEKLLTDFTDQQQLAFCELLHPWQRLHDLWCCKPGKITWVPFEEWSEEKWRASTMHLHPVLNCDEIKILLKAAIAEHRTINFKVGHNYAGPYHVDPIMAKLLLDLADGPKPYTAFLTGETADFVKAAVLVAGSGQDVESWLRMILVRLADPLYVLICPALD